MENRMKLNKKPVYELPGDIIIGEYKRNYYEPNFEPDLCIVMWGRNVGEETIIYKNMKQLWIKTDNRELISFIRSYNWRGIRNNAPNAELSKNTFKKIILEEFYNKSNC